MPNRTNPAMLPNLTKAEKILEKGAHPFNHNNPIPHEYHFTTFSAFLLLNYILFLRILSLATSWLIVDPTILLSTSLMPILYIPYHLFTFQWSLVLLDFEKTLFIWQNLLVITGILFSIKCISHYTQNLLNYLHPNLPIKTQQLINDFLNKYSIFIMLIHLPLKSYFSSPITFFLTHPSLLCLTLLAPIVLVWLAVTLSTSKIEFDVPDINNQDQQRSRTFNPSTGQSLKDTTLKNTLETGDLFQKDSCEIPRSSQVGSPIHSEAETIVPEDGHVSDTYSDWNSDEFFDAESSRADDFFDAQSSRPFDIPEKK